MSHLLAQGVVGGQRDAGLLGDQLLGPGEGGWGVPRPEPDTRHLSLKIQLEDKRPQVNDQIVPLKWIEEVLLKWIYIQSAKK